MALQKAPANRRAVSVPPSRTIDCSDLICILFPVRVRSIDFTTRLSNCRLASSRSTRYDRARVHVLVASERRYVRLMWRGYALRDSDILDGLRRKWRRWSDLPEQRRNFSIVRIGIISFHFILKWDSLVLMFTTFLKTGF